MADEIMTVPDVAEYLKLSASTVYRLAEHKKIPASKVGGVWRFRKRKLDAWLAAKEGLP